MICISEQYGIFKCLKKQNYAQTLKKSIQMKRNLLKGILNIFNANKALVLALSISAFSGYYALGLNKQSDGTPVAKETPVATGKSIYEGKCGKCHKLFEPKKYNAAQWTKWVNRMAPKAGLSAEEKDMVYKYLTQDSK